MDPEILAYQQSAKRQMTQAFLANLQAQPKVILDAQSILSSIFLFAPDVKCVEFFCRAPQEDQTLRVPSKDHI